MPEPLAMRMEDAAAHGAALYEVDFCMSTVVANAASRRTYVFPCPVPDLFDPSHPLAVGGCVGSPSSKWPGFWVGRSPYVRPPVSLDAPPAAPHQHPFSSTTQRKTPPVETTPSMRLVSLSSRPSCARPRGYVCRGGEAASPSCRITPACRQRGRPARVRPCLCPISALQPAPRPPLVAPGPPYGSFSRRRRCRHHFISATEASVDAEDAAILKTAKMGSTYIRQWIVQNQRRGQQQQQVLPEAS
ncbi:hypothetical protein NUW54_g11530 [Trametes sanguinea]|uniref:Uncharacterized protein n=1 Tax=Trametes sanguinea TaxID=158606 RepID=A0ACC1NE27_9APHY|nr:hypothetical protein NUW54_g11530 [Trametes sanguinea]